MRTTVLVLCSTVLGLTLAKPEGYYHQQYNYKTSSQSYRNNELQHKSDDEGYYEKQGDLEGRTRPKVRANSEHSEYINPKLSDISTGFHGGPGGETSSYGHLMAENTMGTGSAFQGNSGMYGSRYGQYGTSSEGIASSDHIAGTSYNYQGGYRGSSSLQHITRSIEEELNRELESAMYQGQAQRLSVTELENELRRNLTARLQDALRNQYGSQTIKGGYSYTLSGGRLQPVANYEQADLVTLQRQLEDSLLQRLRNSYSRYQESHQSSSYNRYYNREASTTYRPATYVTYSTIRPEIRPEVRPAQVIYPSQTRYTPVPNPEPINIIATRVQSVLDTRLNQLLDEAQRQYFSDNARYTTVDLDAVLDRLRQELRNNITYQLNEEILRQYGTQVQRDGYMYTVGPNGQHSGQHNYNVNDLQNYSRQIETHLLDKLNRDFDRYRTRWLETRQHRVQETHTYNDYTTVRTLPRQNYDYPAPDLVPRYEYTTPRHPVIGYYGAQPTSPSIVPMISSGVKGGRHYSASAGSAYGGYEVSGAAGGNIMEMQRQLQDNLSRQLQAALYRSRQTYDSAGYGNMPSYDTSYQQLYDELNRNLTRQMQEYEGRSSYGTYGSESQLASMRQQLERNLASQLQQGLKQTYSSSSSYSASSSSSSHSSGGAAYRTARGSNNDNYYQLGFGQTNGGYGIGGEDCVADDANAYLNHRTKRSYNSYGGYRSRPLGLSTNTGIGGYSASYGAHAYSPSATNHLQTGQEEDDTDLTQQVQRENLEDLGQQPEDLGQQPDDSDLTQQVEDSGFGKLQVGQQQEDFGQQNLDDVELVQKPEDSHFGKIEVGQQVDDSDLTQQVEDNHQTFQQPNTAYGKLESGQQQVDLGQQVDDSDLTQQVEDNHYENYQKPVNSGRLESGNHLRPEQVDLGQEVDDSDLTQQVENNHFQQLLPKPAIIGGYGKLESSNQLGQQVDNSDLTQQVEDNHYENFQQPSHHTGYGKLERGNQLGQQQIDLGQEVDNSDLTQQVEDNHYENFQQPSHHTGYGKLESGNQLGQQQVDLGQEVDNSDLTQQVEEDNFGNLEVGSHYKPVTNAHQAPDAASQVKHLLEEKLSKKLKLVLNDFKYEGTYSAYEAKQKIINYLKEELHKLRNTYSVTYSEELQILSDLDKKIKQAFAQYGYEINEPTSQQSLNQVSHQIPDALSQVKHQLEEKLTTKLQLALSDFKYDSAYEAEQKIIDYLKQELRKNQNAYTITYSQEVQILAELEKRIKQTFAEYGYEIQEPTTQRNLNQQTIDQDTDLTQQVEDNGFGKFEVGSQQKPLTIGQATLNQNFDSQSQVRQELETNLNAKIKSVFDEFKYGGVQSAYEAKSKLSSYLLGEIQKAEYTYHLTQEEKQQLLVDLQRKIQTAFDLHIGSQPTLVQVPQGNSINHKPHQTQQGFQQTYPSLRPVYPYTYKPADNHDFLQREIANGGYNINIQPAPQNPNLPTLNQVVEHNQKPLPLEVGSQHLDDTQQVQTGFDQSPQPRPIILPQQPMPTNQQPTAAGQQVQTGFPQPNVPVIAPQSPVGINQQPGHHNVYVRPRPVYQTRPYVPIQGQHTVQTNQEQVGGYGGTRPLYPTDQDGSQSLGFQGQTGIGVTSQGQFVSQQQSRENAEQTSDALVEALRQAQRNRQAVDQGQQMTDQEQVGNVDQGTSQWQQSKFTFDNNQQLQVAQQLENDLYKQLKENIEAQWQAARSTSGYVNYQTYQLILRQLQNDLKKNLTECVSGSTEPGLSKYSDLIAGKFNPLELETLQKLLEKDLTHKLEEDLRKTYSSNSNSFTYYSRTNGHSSSHSYGSSYGASVHYGQPQEVHQTFETVPEIQPVRPQQAHRVYSGGVKGGRRRLVPQQSMPEPKAQYVSPESEIAHVESIEPIEPLAQPSNPVAVGNEIVKDDTAEPSETSTEPLSWWGKVKQGAKKIKSKIVGG